VVMGSKKISIPPPLSARDKSSFAYKTISDRLPVIIVKTIDFLHRQRKDLQKYGLKIVSDTSATEVETDVKTVIAYLAELRKQLETNKPLVLLDTLELETQLCHFNDDVEPWNKALEACKFDDGTLPRWFDSAWLLVECYLYRRIKDAMLRTKHLKMFDPFIEQKRAACRASLNQMNVIAVHLANVETSIKDSVNQCHPSERTEFNTFVQLALWANKSDLSISGMSADKILSQTLATNIRDSLDPLQKNILCNNISELWFKFQSIKSQFKARVGDCSQPDSKSPIFIDLVADNSGYEIFVDLCLVNILSLMLTDTKTKDSVKFRIHVKRMPWFVSDALRQDIDWLLEFITASERDSSLQALGENWRASLESGHWTVHDHKFWTLPHDYSEMSTMASDLYASLAESKLIIFKGDLNYRKLTGDRKWHILTPFRAALREFGPAPLVALRTAKADVVVGIEDMETFARINNNELPRDWMISGNFGLIQFMDPN